MDTRRPGPGEWVSSTESTTVVPGFDLGPWDQPVVFGVDRVHVLGAELERLGRKHPLVLCSWRRRRSEEFRHLAGGLGMTPSVFQGAEAHVPRHVLEAAWRAAGEHDADAVISFGGGSSIDLGKALVFVALHGWDAFDRAPGDRQPKEKPIVHVAIPTTYSGAESTHRFWVAEGQAKPARGGPGVRPDLVVADPALALSLPWKPTGGTGLTALAHCVEGLWSPSRTAWTDSVACQAAGTIFRLLPVVSKGPKRVRERTELLGAAYAAGVVSDVGGTPLHEVLCNALGARTGIPHGLAAAILLPHTMRLHLEAAGDGSARLAEALGVAGSEEAVDAIEALATNLGLPRRLREVGVFEQDLELVAAGSAEPGLPASVSPKAVPVTDALALLRAAW